MTPSAESMELYNSRVIGPYLQLIKERYPLVDINEIMAYARIMPWEAADQSHWLTQEQVNRFTERAIALTGNPGLAREAGQFATAQEAMGAMRSYVLSFVNPATVFERLGKIVSRLSRSSVYTSKRISNNAVEITVVPNPQVEEEPFQCENRVGCFESILQLFNYQITTIEHPECMFKGGQFCRYIVRWDITKATQLNRLRNFSLLALPILNLPIAFKDPSLLSISIPSSLVIYLAMDRISVGTRLREVSTGMEHLSSARDRLIEQLDANYNNAMLTSEIGQAISSQTSIDLVLNSVVKVLEKRLDFDRGLILLADDEKQLLTYRAGFGHENKHKKILERASFRLDNPASRGVFIEAFKNQIPFLVDDFESFERRHTAHSVNLAKALGVKSFVCCPIVCEGESIGVLAVDNLRSSRKLMQRDKSLLMGIAPVIGVAIRNAELLLAKDKEFRSTLQVLAASIDARDPLTAGHSEKVTEYSVGICEEMDVDIAFRECVRVAALLHDYGKIGVPDAILKKEGRLDEEEYEVIKTHTLQTRNILEQINFEGKYQDVPIIAGAHHEKWDGSGYPFGQKGKDIHLGARIVAVADFYEAITSERHYRQPMPMNVAVDLVAEQSGTAFDPDVVEAFLRYHKRHYNGHSEGNSGGGEVCELRPKRIPVKNPVDIRTKNGSCRGETQDISLSGAYISLPEDISEGIFIRITMTLPGMADPIEAAGRIAWSNTGNRPPKPHFPKGYGVEFTYFSEDGEQALHNYLHKQMHEEEGLMH